MGKAKDSITYLTLIVKVLGVLERALPAFLVAWNNYLSQKAAAAKLELDRLKTEQRIEKREAEILKANEKKTSVQIIADFLRKK